MDSRELPVPPPPPPHYQTLPAASQSTPAALPNPFAPNLHSDINNAAASPSVLAANSSVLMQSPGFPFNSAQYGGGSQPSGAEPAKKKRGRPRKYSPEGNSTALGLATSHTPAHPRSSSALLSPSGRTPSSDAPTKRRGRPPGSGKKQLDALGSFGVGFTPHVIMVEAGEDIASKILAFSQQGPRTVCILSATGAVSNVTLRQPSSSGGTMTYEGRYEIIALSGSYLLSEDQGSRSRVGGLSVSLAAPNGHVLGGGVVGVLKAAISVQVIVGSFIADGKKPKSGPSSPQLTNLLNFGAPAGSPPASQVPSSESSEENGNACLFNRGPGFYGVNNATSQAFHGMPIHPNMVWPNATVQMLPR